jgi:hypothetical protein
MDFHQRRETQLPRTALQPHEVRLPECRHDQERRIGAIRTRLEQLILVDNEVLAKERQCDRPSHGGEMLERAVEERWLRKHRDCHCPAGFVLASDGHWVVIGGKHATRWRAPLALRDDIRSPGLRQCCEERLTSRRGLRCASFERGLTLPPATNLGNLHGRRDDRSKQVWCRAHATTSV